MINLGDILVRFLSDDGPIRDSMARVEQQAQSFGAGVGSFLQDAFAFASGSIIADGIMNIGQRIMGLKDQVMGSVQSFEDMRATVSALTAGELIDAGMADNFTDALKMAKPVAEETLDWMEKLAIVSPFKASDVQSAFQLAQTYGFLATGAKSVKEAQDGGIVTAQRLTEAMMNFTAATGQSPAKMQQIALALGQMSSMGKVSGQELNQLTSSAVQAKRILADEFAGGSTVELQRMTEAGLIPANEAILAIVQDMEIMGGAAAETANNWRGIFASFSDIGSFSLRDMFMPALEEVKPLFIELVSFLQTDIIQNGIESVGQSLSNMLAGPMDWLMNTVLPALKGGWDGIAPAVDMVVFALDGLGTVAGNIASQAASWGGGIINEMASGMMNAIGTIEGAISSIGSVISYWMEPKSPPNFLPEIDQWGRDTMGVWKEGFVSTPMGDLAVVGDRIGAVLEKAGGAIAASGATVGARLAGALVRVTGPSLMKDMAANAGATIRSYLGAWNDADFSVFQATAKGIQGVVDAMVTAKGMSDTEGITAVIGSRAGLAAIVDQLRVTGTVSESAFNALRESAGKAGAEVENLVRQTVAAEAANRKILSAKGDIQSADADLLAAQVGGNAAAIGAARQRSVEARQRLRQAENEKRVIDQRLSREQQIREVMKEQAALLAKMSEAAKGKGGGGGGGGGDKKEDDKAAQAQWQYNFALADTATKIDMLQAKRKGLTEADADYWQLTGQIESLEKQRGREAVATADKELQKSLRATDSLEKQKEMLQAAQAETVKGSDEWQRYQDQIDGVTGKQVAEGKKREQAEWNYNYAIKDTTGKLQMQREKLAGLDSGSEEYFQTLTQINSLENQIEKDRERAAKKAGGGKGGARAPAKPGGGTQGTPGASVTPAAAERELSAQEKLYEAKVARMEAEDKKMWEAARRRRQAKMIGDLVAQAPVILGAMATGFLQALPAAITAIGQVGVGLLNGMKGVAERFFVFGTLAVTEVGSALTANLPRVLRALEAWVPDLVLAGVRLATTLITGFAGLSVQIGAALYKNAPAILASLKVIGTEIGVGLRDMLPDIKTAGIGLLTALTAPFTRIATTLAPMIEQSAPAVLSRVLAFGGQLGTGLATAIPEGMRGSLGLLLGGIVGVFAAVRLTPLLTPMIAGLSALGPAIAPVATMISGALLTGFRNIVPALKMIGPGLAVMRTAFISLAINAAFLMDIIGATGIRGAFSLLVNPIDLIRGAMTGMQAPLRLLPNLLKLGAGGFLTVGRTLLGLLSPFNIILTLVTGFIGAWSVNFQNIQGVTQTALAPVLTLFGALVGVLRQAMAAFGDGGLNAAVGTLGQGFMALSPFIQTALGSLANGILQIIPIVLAYIGQTTGEMMVAMGAAVPGIVAVLAEWAAAIWKWIPEAIPPLLVQLLGLITALGNWIAEVAPGVGTQLGIWAVQFLTWIPTAISQMMAGLMSLIGIVIAWIVENAGPLLMTLGSWALSFGAWVLGAGLPALLGALATLIANFLNWITTEGPVILTQLAEWGKQFMQFIVDAWPGALEALNTFISDVLGWATKTGGPALSAGMKNVGDALVAGIRAGITAAWGAFENWLGEQVGKIPEPVRKALGIKSPSTLMGDRVGKWLFPGVQEAAAKTVGPVGQALAGMAQQMIGKAQDSLGGLTVPMTLQAAAFQGAAGAAGSGADLYGTMNASFDRLAAILEGIAGPVVHVSTGPVGSEVDVDLMATKVARRISEKRRPE